MNAIAIIPARGGSQRIKRKNIRRFHGQPIMLYSIAAAKQSGLFTEVWVSTEDDEIGKIALRAGVNYHHRNAVLAENGVGTQEVVRAALLDKFPVKNGTPKRPEFTCCIYPCAPMLWTSDLVEAYRTLLANDALQYVMAVGAFYFGRTEAFLNSVPLEDQSQTLIMDLGQRGIDIDVMADWREAERLYPALLEP
jgi:N-acylneuraminate cytidylyltransferase